MIKRKKPTKVNLLSRMEVFAEEKPKREKPKKEYNNIIEPIELQVADRAKLVFSASSTGEDKPVHVDIRTYITNPDESKYSGPTQKGINFDVKYLDEFIETLKEVSEGLKRKINKVMSGRNSALFLCPYRKEYIKGLYRSVYRGRI